jgi:hypothetical protein
MRVFTIATALLFAYASSAQAFCGFYVATTDQKLTNRASRVVLVHQDGHTIVTMASDVHGDPKQFALVIPVPTVIKRDQVRIVEPQVVEHLAEYTKPRLVQYFDPDPCAPRVFAVTRRMPVAAAGPAMAALMNRVQIEAAFSVEEYDIKVLGAADSNGLIDWLNRNGYRMPQDAAPVIGSYIKQHMHFFVAKVNLEHMQNNPSGFLRPIRVAYDTDKFMLPIRLGTVNADGPQDMIVLALTETGRVDVTNYRTVRMPSGVNVPEYIAEKFGSFYDTVFDRQVKQADGSSVFLEYAWPIGGGMQLCDPCSSMPMDQQELSALGADWPSQPDMWGQPMSRGFVTRLHVRYDRAHFPEDLQFQETPDAQSFQARFVIQVASKRRTMLTCAAGRAYRDTLHLRWRAENATLAQLTGWAPADIRAAMVAHWNRTREN